MSTIQPEMEFRETKNRPSASFRRILSRPGSFIPEVDGLRFVAIAAVVLFHLAAYTMAKHMQGGTIAPLEAWIPAVCSRGHYGVELFFTLSGFLVALPFARWRLGLDDRPSLKRFYLRRLTRLEPPYVLTIILMFAGSLGVLGLRAGLARLPHFLASLIYQHNLIYNSINGVTWSLEIEAQFYLLAPILTAVFAIRRTVLRRLILLSAAVGIPLLRMIGPEDWSVKFNSLPWHIEFFVAGFFLTDLYLLNWCERQKKHWWGDVYSLIGWISLGLLAASNTNVLFLMPLATIIAYVGALTGQVSSWVLTRPTIVGIGGMCYSIYLLHYEIISIAGRISTRFSPAPSFTARFAVDAGLAITAVLCLSTLFYLTIERPCMNPGWPQAAMNRLRKFAFAQKSRSASA